MLRCCPGRSGLVSVASRRADLGGRSVEQSSASGPTRRAVLPNERPAVFVCMQPVSGPRRPSGIARSLGKVSRAGAARQPRAAALFEAVLSRRRGYFRSFSDVIGRSTQISISSRDIKLNGPRSADLEAFLMMAKRDLWPTRVFARSERRLKGLSAACLRSQASRARVGPTDEAKKPASERRAGGQEETALANAPTRRHRRTATTGETDHES